MSSKSGQTPCITVSESLRSLSSLADPNQISQPAGSPLPRCYGTQARALFHPHCLRIYPVAPIMSASIRLCPWKSRSQYAYHACLFLARLCSLASHLPMALPLTLSSSLLPCPSQFSCTSPLPLSWQISRSLIPSSRSSSLLLLSLHL
jgi:hypothetical protein